MKHVEQKRQEMAVVLQNERLDAVNVMLTLRAPSVSAQATPGQFVELDAGQFLNRPIGIALTDRGEGTIALGISTVGAGTNALAALQPGESVRVLGPFGFGFTFGGVTRAYVVGGGSGIYPLLFLLRTLRDKGIETFAGCGFRTAGNILLKDDFLAASDQYLSACEIGGGDVSGTAIDALNELYAQHGKCDGTRVYACGPLPMLNAVNKWCEAHDLDAECSFEARMGCGFGVCRGCAVPVIRNGGLDYDRCCVEGPVFNRTIIGWEALA